MLQTSCFLQTEWLVNVLTRKHKRARSSTHLSIYLYLRWMCDRSPKYTLNVPCWPCMWIICFGCTPFDTAFECALTKINSYLPQYHTSHWVEKLWFQKPEFLWDFFSRHIKIKRKFDLQMSTNYSVKYLTFYEKMKLNDKKRVFTKIQINKNVLQSCKMKTLFSFDKFHFRNPNINPEFAEW